MLEFAIKGAAVVAFFAVVLAVLELLEFAIGR
jgi:hypothetical protein